MHQTIEGITIMNEQIPATGTDRNYAAALDWIKQAAASGTTLSLPGDEGRLQRTRSPRLDLGSTNGTFLGLQRLDRIEISAECVVRLGNPDDGPVLRSMRLCRTVLTRTEWARYVPPGSVYQTVCPTRQP